MANRTTNIGLIKPIGAENFDIEHFNNNADIIDGEIAGTLQKIEEIRSDYAKNDLTNIENDAFKAKAEEAGVGGGIPIVTATSSDGIAYTATVNGITSLEAGMKIVFKSSKQSESEIITLDINGLGAKGIYPSDYRLSVFNDNGEWVDVGYQNEGFAESTFYDANTPLELIYTGSVWRTTSNFDVRSVYVGVQEYTGSGTVGSQNPTKFKCNTKSHFMLITPAEKAQPDGNTFDSLPALLIIPGCPFGYLLGETGTVNVTYHYELGSKTIDVSFYSDTAEKQMNVSDIPYIVKSFSTWFKIYY